MGRHLDFERIVRRPKGETALTLNHIQFDGINLNAVFPQPFYSGSKDFLIAGDF